MYLIQSSLMKYEEIRLDTINMTRYDLKNHIFICKVHQVVCDTDMNPISFKIYKYKLD